MSATSATHSMSTMTPPSFSPVSSVGSTPHNISPASPRQHQSALAHPSHPAHAATKQMRPPKSPMYVPAVLRPTEKPLRQVQTNPPTPPRSSYSSSDSLQNTTAQRRPSSSRARPVSPTQLTRADTSSSTLTAPPSPTQGAMQPTRAHWKPDAQAVRCDAAGCGIAFGLLARRHHCRRCGGVFCNQHSAHQVPLDADAEFDATGAWSRACAACGQLWADRMVAQLQSEEGRAIAIARPKGHGGQGHAVGSVPKDWTWSTF